MAANFGVAQILLLANLIVMSFSTWMFWKSANASIQPLLEMEAISFMPSNEGGATNNQQLDSGRPLNSTTAGIGSTDPAGFYFVHPKEGERNFYKIGKGTHTDKVTAPGVLPRCLENDKECTRPNCTRPECRPWGHHYDTLYQQRLGPYSRGDVEPFQFLEIGFFNGAGYDTVSVHRLIILENFWILHYIARPPSN